MTGQTELTGKKVYMVTSVAQYRHNDVKKNHLATIPFSTQEKARKYLHQHAKNMYWDHIKYPEYEFDEEENDINVDKWDDTPKHHSYNRCSREVKKNNMYIMRTESYEDSFIQHNCALVNMDILLIDQGVYVKPTKAKEKPHYKEAQDTRQ